MTCNKPTKTVRGCIPLILSYLSSEEQRSRGLQQWLASLPVPLLGEQSSADLQLTVGALIVEEMRAAVEKHTGFRCSAGISHNKVGKPLFFILINLMLVQYVEECSLSLLGSYLTVYLFQVLAKLACGLNKPNRQTVLPLDSVAELFSSLPISKM